jgi:hypothetical protein
MLERVKQAKPFNDPILSRPDGNGIHPRARHQRARPGAALVLANSRGALLTEWHERPLPFTERFRVRFAYQIDVAEHWLRFSCELPCNHDAHRFQADIDLAWRVHDPAEVVRRNLSDVAATLCPWVEQRMRHVSRKVDLAGSEKVEEEINQHLGMAAHRLDCGITITSFYAKVTLDATEHEHLRMLEEVRRQITLERERDALDKARYVNQTRQAERSANLRRREAARLREIVRQGLIDVLAEHLVDHPGDQAYVVTVLRQEGWAKVRSTVTMLQAMLEAKKLEGVDLDRVREHALRSLLAGLELELSSHQAAPGGTVAEIATGSSVVDASSRGYDDEDDEEDG